VACQELGAALLKPKKKGTGGGHGRIIFYPRLFPGSTRGGRSSEMLKDLLSTDQRELQEEQNHKAGGGDEGREKRS